MLPAILALARKVLNSRKSHTNTKSSGHGSRKIGMSRGLTILSVLIMAVAFILGMLCIFAGRKPGMMEDYAIFTLNTSRIGENIRQDLDDEIKSIHFKRAQPVYIRGSTATIAPASLVTVRPRGLTDEFDTITKEAHSRIHHASSRIHSAASSAESEISSGANSVLNAAKKEIIEAVNDAYEGIISGLHLKDFYSVHLMATCSGEYVTSDGKNISVSQTADDSDEHTHKHVDTCDKNSAINPTTLILIVYWIGIAFTAAALIAAFVAVLMTGRKIALVNVALTGAAFCFVGLASAVTHGIASGAAKLVNFVGENIGVAGYAGQKFLALTWATTVLLLINAILWSVLFFLRGRAESGSSKRAKEHDTFATRLGPISHPMPVHDRRNMI